MCKGLLETVDELRKENKELKKLAYIRRCEKQGSATTMIPGRECTERTNCSELSSLKKPLYSSQERTEVRKWWLKFSMRIS